MIDEGETDWKVVAIALNDPLAKHLNGEYLIYIKDLYCGLFKNMY